MKIKTMLLFFIVSSFVIGCARLDDNLFSPTTTTEYKLDAYTGKKQFEIPDRYSIAEDKISFVTLKSGASNKKINIAGLFVGDLARIKDADYRVILYCHGNSENLDYYWNRIKLLANVGSKNQLGVMAMDYRGYGTSDGQPTEEGLYEDVDAAMKWLKDQGLTDERLIIYGYSMGTAPTVELATSPRTLTPTKVILESPFASAKVMVQDAIKFSLPSSFVTNLKINNADRIKTMTQPLLWFHGTADSFLSIKSHGEVVFKNHPGIENSGKFANRIIGAEHNNVPKIIADQEGSFDDYLAKIFTFINL